MLSWCAPRTTRRTRSTDRFIACFELRCLLQVSYKPGDAEKLGVDYQSLRARNPGLIYAEITGYGPQDSRVGYDAVIQAESGFTYMNGEPDQASGTKMPVALVDVLAAHSVKQGILLRLWERDRVGGTGEGGLVSVSLMGAAASSTVNQANSPGPNPAPDPGNSSSPHFFSHGASGD